MRLLRRELQRRRLLQRHRDVRGQRRLRPRLGARLLPRLYMRQRARLLLPRPSWLYLPLVVLRAGSQPLVAELDLGFYDALVDAFLTALSSSPSESHLENRPK